MVGDIAYNSVHVNVAATNRSGRRAFSDHRAPRIVVEATTVIQLVHRVKHAGFQLAWMPDGNSGQAESVPP